MSKDKDDSISFGIGLLAGVVGGIIAGIIYAPKPGAETRADLVDKAIKIKNLKQLTRLVHKNKGTCWVVLMTK